MADTSEDAARREQVYEIIGEVVDGIVAQACERHYFAPTQENQFTSKIADRIEQRLNDMNIFGISVNVHAQDFPDKGAGSMERKSGGDVYISVVVNAPGVRINKEMMIQSKWDDAISTSAARRSLHQQTEKMRARTKSSYVWVYGPSSIAVVPSDDVSEGRIDLSNVKTVGGLISDSLRCREGDPSISRDLTLPIPQLLSTVMERLSADHAISFELSEPE